MAIIAPAILATIAKAKAMSSSGTAIKLSLTKATTLPQQKMFQQLITELVKEKINFETITTEFAKKATTKAQSLLPKELNVIRKFNFDNLKDTSKDEKEYKEIAFVRSKWLYNCKYTPINDNEGTIYITFKTFTTNGKPPVLIRATKGQYYQFIKAKSVGNYYYYNFSIYANRKFIPTASNFNLKQVFNIASNKNFKQPQNVGWAKAKGFLNYANKIQGTIKKL